MKKTIAWAIAFALLSGCVTRPPGKSTLDRVETIVVIYAENRSFDHLYGTFPGANGIANATPQQRTQLDLDGSPLPYLPPVYVHGKADPSYPQRLPNGPFRADAPPVNHALGRSAPSPTHRYWQNIEQINGGRNNMFVALSGAGSWTMAYFDGSSQKLWDWAKRYTLADNFFTGAFGGSFLNHQWLACACTPVFEDAAPSIRPRLDVNERLARRPESPASVLHGPPRLYDGLVTPDGYAVNSMQPPYQPSGLVSASASHPELSAPAPDRLPPQTQRTIGDALSEKGISWAWYAEGWREALADGARAREARRVIYNEANINFQPHHQPFNYFANYAPGTRARTAHLKDGDEFVDAIERGTLPAVAFYKPSGRNSQHPEDSDVATGDAHIAALLERLEKSRQWPHMIVVVTYDENGGFWDHVPPPSGEGWSDRWGPGNRVPAIIVSPFAKRGFVDHTSYDTTAILKLITRRFGLEPLPGVRRNTGDLTNALAPSP